MLEMARLWLFCDYCFNNHICKIDAQLPLTFNTASENCKVVCY